MKTTLAIALALGLGAASIGWAFDQDALNSKLHNRSYGKMEMKEKNIEKTTIASEKTTIVSEEKAVSEKKATVAVTRDASISPEDRDLSVAEPVSAHSSKGNTFK